MRKTLMALPSRRLFAYYILWARKSRPNGEKAMSEANGKENRCKGGPIRIPQLRILLYLSTQVEPKTRKEIVLGAHVGGTAMPDCLGSLCRRARTSPEENYHPSLVTLGLVRCGPTLHPSGREVEGYVISAKGRALLEKLSHEFHIEELHATL
jgi:hypothetical protein